MPITILMEMQKLLKNSSRTLVSFQKHLLLSLESEMKLKEHLVVQPRNFSKILDPKKSLIFNTEKGSLSLVLKDKSNSLRREVLKMQ